MKSCKNSRTNISQVACGIRKNFGIAVNLIPRDPNIVR